MKILKIIKIVILVSLTVQSASLADKAQFSREAAKKAYTNRNYKDAFAIYRKLCLDSQANPKLVGNDLNMLTACLGSLNRISEIDDLREEIIARQQHNWRFLFAAAQNVMNNTHYGYIVGGKFKRGNHRGGGKYVNSQQRDRVRSLQLYAAAMRKSRGEKNHIEVANFYRAFAGEILHSRGYNQSWRLQYLTDLTKLPDYNAPFYYSSSRGAPVGIDGSPIFYKLPLTFAKAKNDGERWRWLLLQAMELDPKSSGEIQFNFAQFLYQQFGVQTLSNYSWYFRSSEDDEQKKSETGIRALHTLKENETVTRLATGVKRFTLPSEFNYLKIFTQLASSEQKNHYGGQAIKSLAVIYENRRQYDKALKYWKAYKRYYKEQAESHIKQIADNWGVFEPVMSQPAGKGARVDYRFRNGKSVTFTARRLDIKKLLQDLKNYVKLCPKTLDWNRLNLGNIGYRLVYQNQTQYIREEVANWTLKLQPRSRHFDKRIQITTPLQKAGAYLLEAKLQNGNVSRIIIWLSDTAIVKKNMAKKSYFYVADARSGVPLGKVNLEFFGYRQEWQSGTRNYQIKTSNFAESTDGRGQVFLEQKQHAGNYQWLIIATTPGGRLAWQGFSGIWYNNYYDYQYNQVKAFAITDRPVYRPKQELKFKFWVRHAKYDLGDTSKFANKNFRVSLRDPRGQEVFKKTLLSDEYGGFAGSWLLPADAVLGTYWLRVINYSGAVSFRVEEYKKPEFEVKIDSPTEPLLLGEKITATIRAKYYFGAPVTKATVKYKVLRYSHSANWYPAFPWDWFYGVGYWWYAYDYLWYPGWREWGCKRPIWWWYGNRSTPPEVVSENEVPIGADGTVKISIDTSLAKEMHGDIDHRYTITAEVRDDSRRTIVGTGSVLVARKPFKVYTWVDRGYYQTGDTISASFSAHTLDNKPVKGRGILRLFRITYDQNSQPVEKLVEKWKLPTDGEGKAKLQLKAGKSGQYRLAYSVTDSKRHQIEGGYIFVIRGEDFASEEFRFNNLELVTDKPEYKLGEKVKLMINTNRSGSTVLLFIRPANSVYLPPKIINLQGKSTIEEIVVSKKDMPNFFVEAITIANGKLYTETREIIIPPEKRVLNLEVLPVKNKYKPGEEAQLMLKLTDFFGKPFVGTTVLSVYDKSVEYISGGSNIPEIKQFFWKWRRRHYPRTESSLNKYFSNLLKENESAMAFLGVFGYSVADSGNKSVGNEEEKSARPRKRMLSKSLSFRSKKKEGRKNRREDKYSLMGAVAEDVAAESSSDLKENSVPASQAGSAKLKQPTVRSKFADTAYWATAINTDKDGYARIKFNLPENLTTWKLKVWAMGHGTKVGEGSAEIVTSKDLLLRMQTPRFFVQKDEVTLSANVHNYLKNSQIVTVVLELDGKALKNISKAKQRVRIEPNSEARIDWRVKVIAEGEAVVRMKALSSVESDAMEMRFPVLVHGMDKMVAQCGVIRTGAKQAEFVINVPKERRLNSSRLEIRYSPTLAGALVDALPYLIEYPHKSTDQTLNRFLPAVITQRILSRLGVKLSSIKDKKTNLNAQEIGDDAERSKGWKRYKRNPVFAEYELSLIVKDGVKRLTNMQLSDGGWGWFSGWGEYSSAHMTATVVRGLQVAQENDIAIVPGVMQGGVKWLKNYQADEVEKLKNALAEKKINPWKSHADNLDVLVYMVLAEAEVENRDMREFIYRDRSSLSVYALAMYGLAMHKQKQAEKLKMIMQNIEQYLVEDKENQTAYLKLGNEGYWWYWYGSEWEAHAYYLKLLSRTAPKSEKAAGLVKYLLNNRKHATYWNSTRDTALCVEAIAEFLKASGEDKPDMTVEIFIDNKKYKEVRIKPDNLFNFDNKLVISGDAVEGGRHTIQIRRKGKGPLYYNSYLSYFTLEDYIKKAGLEIKVERKYYRLRKVDKKIKVAGSRGQVLEQRVEKYEREELKNGAILKSGELVEIELEIESKNDYEYLLFTDLKPAGFEPVKVRSGYLHEGLRAYLELRDQKVCFFIQRLARGKHSVSYRMRAEIPGCFSALPTLGSALYAPELRANADELKLQIVD